MDVEQIKLTVDKYYEENRPDKAEELLIGAISVAMDEQDGMSLLQLLNELIGIYRETSRVEDSYAIGEEILSLAQQILPEESIPFATSCLNVATAYRAGGRLEDALALYRRVEKIYAAILPPNHKLAASMYNNESLLFQELGDFAGARDNLEKALSIVVALGEQYEEAVTRANLAGTLVQLGELEAGFAQANAAIALFEQQGVKDGHYAAALSALGSMYYIQKEYSKGAKIFEKAMECMEEALGRNAFYERLRENRDACKKMMEEESRSGMEAAGGGEAVRGEKTVDGGEAVRGEKTANEVETGMRGMDICRRYFEQYGKPMLKEQFADYLDRMAVGLSGAGSDCFGFDDEISRDHDWGPSFCIWIPRALYEEIGEKLEAAYAALPEEMDEIKRAPEVNGKARRGVRILEDYLETFGIDVEKWPYVDWGSIPDVSLASLVNGEIWMDEGNLLSPYRQQLKKGYPGILQYQKMAEAGSRFSRAGQYNILRCKSREDSIGVAICVADALREAMKLLYYIENKFPPHDKWLSKGVEVLLRENGNPAGDYLGLLEGIAKAKLGSEEQIALLEELGSALAMEMYRRDYISDIDPYLDHQAQELLEKGQDCMKDEDTLAMEIAKLEFEAFDQVQNEGGRASCQNNWPTFSIMRRSQYLTWTKTMQLQYLYDFRREMSYGHNLITEKYGRMMESTAPEKYEELKVHFPEITEEKKRIIEQIVAIQVDWMETFAKEYPLLADQARSVHTYEDNPYNTSYETYLRGEISTYSDKMLELYARFIVEHVQGQKNLAYETMENSCRLYGYKDLAAAEAFLEL